MYGMVNQAVRGLVLDAFGEAAWTAIYTEAGAPESFVSMQKYDDSITYGLVAAAEVHLELSAQDILHAFGEYWVLKIATVHYPQLMNASGGGFLDFVKNLDHMHQRIRVTFPDYNPPSFRVKDLTEGAVQVDYYSDREGLLPFVKGLFMGLGQHFKVSVEIEDHDDTSHPLPCKRMTVRHRSLELLNE